MEGGSGRPGSLRSGELGARTRRRPSRGVRTLLEECVVDVRIADDEDGLARAVAGQIQELAVSVLKQADRFSLVLAGGATPRRLYERLSSPPHRTEVPWPRMHVFWGDERFVPPDLPDSNAAQARQAFLDKVPIPQENIHPMPTESGSLESSAERYEKSLRDYFGGHPPRFNLVLLGVGEDGHVASLFPGSTALLESVRWVVPVRDAPKPPPERLTLTLPVINQAERVFFLVAGAQKAEIVRSVLNDSSLRLPAQLVRPAPGSLTWWVDRDAARHRPGL
ncbi:MAG: 6-phosphogluconolactonase [Elusimicrobia bacterium]|nr:6-phosphogluconolactonase [Elusimicrobiota bacterium]